MGRLGNGGFTNAGVEPWLKVNPNYPQINAEAALDDQDSVFYHYQELAKLRRGELKDLDGIRVVRTRRFG